MSDKFIYIHCVTSFFFCFLQLSLGLATQNLHTREAFNHEGHVLGAFSEQLNSSLFYQSYVPLILKFRVPDWRPEHLRLNKSLLCASDDMTLNHLCPMAYHLEGIISPLSQSMQFYRNIFSASGGDFYEHNFSCDKIKPHFLHFSTNLGGVLPYLNEFRNRCPLGKNVSLVGKSVGPNMPKDAQMAFTKLGKLHEDINSKNQSSSSSPPSSEWKYVEMAGYTSLQNSLLLNQYVDSVRWANAFSTCQSFKLDVGLISPIILNDSLTSIAKNLRDNGYTFSLPFLSTLPHYYKIPLADCILTMSNSLLNFGYSWSHIVKPPPNGANSSANLIVRILVPVVKSGIIHKLIKLNKVPYLRKEKGGDKICEIVNFQPDDVYLLEVNSTTGGKYVVGKVSPFCLTSKLCKVPTVSHRQVVDPCVTGIITQNHELTAKNCFFECFALPNSQLAREKALPIFTQLASNKFAITGLPPDSFPLLLLKCDGKTTHSFQPNTTEGAILLTLPCNCQLVYGFKTFAARQPCSDPFDVEHVIEFGTHHHHQADGEGKNFIDYLIEALDSNLFNLTFSEKAPDDEKNETVKPEKMTGVEVGPPPAQIAQPQYHCGHVVLWIFLITLLILNCLTVFILYRNQLISFNSLLFRWNTNNMTRFENDIPVNNLNSASPL